MARQEDCHPKLLEGFSKAPEVNGSHLIFASDNL